MLISHFKQAWQLIRQNKLFSGIYIFGTALAIASTTIFATVYYVKLAPVYPEKNRNSMSTIVSHEEQRETGWWQGQLSYGAIRKYIYTLKNATAVSAYYDTGLQSALNLNNGHDEIDIVLKPTDPTFFNVFDYDFIIGAPFSNIEFESGARKAVISDRLATKIFGSPESAMGQTVSLEFIKYDICGVFREGCSINSHSYAQVIIPYTSNAEYTQSYPGSFLGLFKVVLLSDDLNALKAELSEVARKYNNSRDDDVSINFWDQPQSAVIDALGAWPSDTEYDLTGIFKFNLLILLTLLIVPALNLSGMIAGRMDSRRSELGVRKSFGATSHRLLCQVLWENLILTVIGGAFGLIISWIVLSTDAASVFSIIGDNPFQSFNTAVHLTHDMLFAPAIFLFAFMICIVLNMLSAFLPAWLSLRNPIVKSLK